MKKLLLVIFISCTYLFNHAQEAELVIPTGHYRNIETIDISQDGKLIATGGDDNSVIIWDAKTWKQLRTITLPEPVGQVLFSADGKSIIITEGSGKRFGMKYSVWNAGNGTLITRLPFQGGDLAVLAPDGVFMAIPSFSTTGSVSFTGDIKNLMVSAGQVGVWNMVKNKKVEAPYGLSRVGDFIKHKNGYYLATAGSPFLLNGKSSIDIWDINHFEDNSVPVPVKSLKVEGQISLLTASRAGMWFATTGGSKGISLRNPDSELPVRILQPSGRIIRSVFFSTDGTSIFCYSDEKEKTYINIWNLADSTVDRYFQLSGIKKRNLVKFSGNGDYFVTDNRDTANVYNMQGALLAQLAGHAVSFSSYVFSADGKYVNTSNKLRGAGATDNKDSINKIVADLHEMMISIMEQQEKTKYSPAKRDTLLTRLIQGEKPSEKNISRQHNFRIWDLQYGSASSYNTDSIRFTKDSVSPDKKYKLLTMYKATGVAYVGGFFADAAKNKDMAPIPGISDSKSFLNKQINDRNSSWNRQSTAVTLLINTKTTDTVYLIALDSTDWIITAPDGYYMASKNAAGLLHYTMNNHIISFEQLDLKNNRPDKILEKIGYADTALVAAYRNAYHKRIEIAGIDTVYFSKKYTVPQVEIENRNSISYLQTNEKLTLHIKAAESSTRLWKFNIWLNHVPLYGAKGLMINPLNKNSFDTTVRIVLSTGDNRIEASVTNIAGVESFRSPVFVKYMPTPVKAEKVYFAGIGIDRFADTSNNLQFCRKDIADLCGKLKAKYGSRFIADTVFNENVTIENIKALKKKLLQSTEEDIVIIAYSGHGLLSNRFDYYLSTYNTQFSQPEKYSLPYQELENLADGLKARKKLMLIDACHSGELDKDEMQKIASMKTALQKEKNTSPGERGIKLPAAKSKLGIKNSFELMQQLFVNTGRGTGTTIIAAAGGTQFALELGNLKNGVFTYSILELLQQDTHITAAALKAHVNRRVAELTKGLQQPGTRNETQNADWIIW